MREMAASIGRRVQHESSFSFFEDLPKCSPAPPELELEEAPGQNNSYPVPTDDLAKMSWALSESKPRRTGLCAPRRFVQITSFRRGIQYPGPLQGERWS
ncbi:hypothetical protein ACEPAI_1728 [Sanghuangporus weigelae]